MFFGIITLLTSLAMATVAAVFAIYGIIAIFAGMPQFALIMGAVIELGKVVGISWLYRNWNEPTKIKYAMTPLVLVAMMLTSMGIFGLLSKAHLEQTSPVANNEIQITRLDQQVDREQSRIIDAEQVISQLDQSVQALIEFDRIRGPDGALAVRESQSEQREVLRQTIDTSQTEVDRLEDQKLELTQELRAIELEVGPVKYIAELVYGDGTDRTEEAVRWVIIAFIFVFDPMAILLLMAANYTLDQRKKKELPDPKIEETKELTTDKPRVVEAIEETVYRNTTGEPDKLVQDTFTEPAEPDIPVEDTSPVPTQILQELMTLEPLVELENISLQPEETIDVEEIELDLFNILDILDDTTSNIKDTDKIIITEGVTPACDIGDGYVKYKNQLFQKDALKEIRPELFALRPDSVTMPFSSFGTSFPKIAKNKDMYVRVDVMPNRVYRFDGSKWIETNKDLTSTYLYDQEYIKYIIDKLEKGEYDIELLSEQEKIHIGEYLSQQSS